MNEFKQELKSKMDEYSHLVYKITRDFPDNEKYGLTSQWRRASMSIVLNYVEGYARFKEGYQIQFCENSYGSFQESKYLLNF